MLRAEERVRELEDSLSQFIDDFETLNGDLTVCAQKLAESEDKVASLTKQQEEEERNGDVYLTQQKQIEEQAQQLQDYERRQRSQQDLIMSL